MKRISVFVLSLAFLCGGVFGVSSNSMAETPESPFGETMVFHFTEFYTLQNSAGDYYTWAEYSERYSAVRTAISEKVDRITAVFDKLQIIRESDSQIVAEKVVNKSYYDEGTIGVSRFNNPTPDITVLEIAFRFYGSSEFFNDSDSYFARLTIAADGIESGDCVESQRVSFSAIGEGIAADFNGEVFSVYCSPTELSFDPIETPVDPDPVPPDIPQEPESPEGQTIFDKINSLGLAVSTIIYTVSVLVIGSVLCFIIGALWRSLRSFR